MIKRLCQFWMLFLSLLTSCVSRKDILRSKEVSNMDNEIFYYEVCCSGPKLNPGKYVYVKFIGDSGTFRCFGNPCTDKGIGCGTDGVSRNYENRYSLPKAIDATWVSFTEKKVYKLTTMLPYDTILGLFKDGGVPCVHPDDNSTKDSKYKKIKCLDLCFLPEGKVMLYVKAPVKKILLDWSDIGVEVTDKEVLGDIHWEKGQDNMESYFDLYYSDEYPDLSRWRTYIKKNGSISPLIDRYLQRFNYKLIFDFEDERTVIDYVRNEYTNGERQSGTSKFNDCFKMPSRLKESRIVWDTKDFHYTCFMYFNEEEMLSVFDEAYGEDRTQKGEFKIKVGKDNNQFDISLNVGDKCLKLEKTEIDVFQDPIDNPDGDGTLIYDNYDERHNYFADDEKYVVD